MPNTNNIALNVPDTGSLPGSWGTTAVNANMTVVDGILAGQQSISLTGSSATTLSIATGVIGTGSITAGSGPTQSANKRIKFTGTLSSNVVVTFPRPGEWIVRNDCTLGGFYLQLRATGTGNVIGVPPGESIIVFNDGTDFDFVNMGRVNTYMQMAVATTPAWMLACTVLPYLPCLGTSTYSSSIYPALSSYLGSTFGGNGINTFAVPDLGNRISIPIDTSGAGRITSAGSGIDGTVLGAAGGSQLLSAHSHVATSSVNDPSHVHPVASYNAGSAGSGSGNIAQAPPFSNSSFNTNSATTNITVNTSIGTTGSGSSGNVPPGLVAGIVFIKT